MIWRGQVFCATSLDGYLAGPDGELEWLESRGEQAGDTGYDAFFAGVDALLLGRGTYEKVLTFGEWPYGGKLVLVLSSTLGGDDERVEVVRSLDEADARLEGDVYVDGGVTITACLAAGLVERLVVTQVPVLLGRGIRLFGELPAEVALEHVATRVLGAGLVQSTYLVTP